MRTAVITASLVAALAPLAAACGSDAPEPPPPPDLDLSAPPEPGAGEQPEPGAGETPDDGDDDASFFEPAPATISDDGHTGTYDCDDQDITVDAANAVVFLYGTCGTVTIEGDSNSISIDAATTITVNGGGNNVATEQVEGIVIAGDFSEVRYSGDPDISVTGENSGARPH